MRRVLVVLTCLTLLAMVLGCNQSAGLALKSSTALQTVADQVQTMQQEYHEEVVEMDDLRETRIVSDLVKSLKANPNNEEVVAAFYQIMKKIRDDREVEMQRHMNGKGTVTVLRKMADQLEQFGLDSIALEDEARRYFTGWLDSYKDMKAKKEAAQAEASAAKKARNQALFDSGVNVLQQFIAKEPVNGNQPVK